MTLTNKSLKINNKSVTVRQATYFDGIQRASLMAKASTEAGAYPKEMAEQMYYYTQTFLLPTLLACSEMKKPFSFEEFLQLPDTDVEIWVETAQLLNPHWFQVEENDSKKEA